MYPFIITALNSPCRTITTSCLILVTTPLATLVLGDFYKSRALQGGIQQKSLLGLNGISGI
jgi:hypothetical protein